MEELLSFYIVFRIDQDEVGRRGGALVGSVSENDFFQREDGQIRTSRPNGPGPNVIPKASSVLTLVEEVLDGISLSAEWTGVCGNYLDRFKIATAGDSPK